MNDGIDPFKKNKNKKLRGDENILCIFSN